MQLRKYRKQAELTQEELGSLLGVSQQTIANYENWHRTPSVRRCMDIVKVMKERGVEVTIQDLFSWSSK